MRSVAAIFLFCSLVGTSSAETPKPTGTVIAFSVAASQSVANDLARATVFAEIIDVSSAAVSRKIRGILAEAIATTKDFPEVKTQSGSTWTSPLFGKNGRSIESWHTRSELELESHNIAALSELLGKLQSNLGVSRIQLQPAAATRKKAEEQATQEAMNAFQEKAQRIASNYKKYYKIIRMNIDTSSQLPTYPMMRGVAVMNREEAAPMPIESGETLVSATVSGEIELVD